MTLVRMVRWMTSPCEPSRYAAAGGGASASRGPARARTATDGRARGRSGRVSRVTLTSVVRAFRTGATPEEIAQQYPSLPLADVYAVVTYYLRHRDDVEAYLSDREGVSQAVRAANEARSDPDGMRERLLARRAG